MMIDRPEAPLVNVSSEELNLLANAACAAVAEALGISASAARGRFRHLARVLADANCIAVQDATAFLVSTELHGVASMLAQGPFEIVHLLKFLRRLPASELSAESAPP